MPDLSKVKGFVSVRVYRAVKIFTFCRGVVSEALGGSEPHGLVGILPRPAGCRLMCSFGVAIETRLR